jgi:predicted nucleic acid-binding protein
VTRYLDASALVKLVVEEDESQALLAHLASAPDVAATSLVAVAEVGIAVTRRGIARSDDVTARPGWVATPSLSAMGMPITPGIGQLAARLGARHGLRALDAIHVATASTLRDSLSEVITYDHRMISACRAVGLRVAVPGGDLGPAV